MSNKSQKILLNMITECSSVRTKCLTTITGHLNDRNIDFMHLIKNRVILPINDRLR